MSVCKFLIEREIKKQEQRQEKAEQITLDKLTEIIYNLLSESYNVAERTTSGILEEKITQRKDLGMSESDIKSDLLKGCQAVVMSDVYCICKIVRNNNIRIFEAFTNIDKKDTFLSSLAEKTAEIYYSDMMNDLQFFDVENVHDFVRDRLYNDFLLAFIHYRLIEALNKKESDNPGQNTGKPQQITTKQFEISMEKDEAENMFNSLIESDFIEAITPLNNFLFYFGLNDKPDTNKPLKWTKTNKTTQDINPNKRSLLDFLTQLGITETEIKLKIKNCFVFSNDSGFNRNNYKYEKGKLITKSDYHSELSEIITKSKKKIVFVNN